MRLHLDPWESHADIDYHKIKSWKQQEKNHKPHKKEKTIWLMTEFASETVEARNIGMLFKEVSENKIKSMMNSTSSKIILQK